MAHAPSRGFLLLWPLSLCVLGPSPAADTKLITVICDTVTCDGFLLGSLFA